MWKRRKESDFHEKFSGFERKEKKKNYLDGGKQLPSIESPGI